MEDAVVSTTKIAAIDATSVTEFLFNALVAGKTCLFNDYNVVQN
jgi:hypothetical protein